jgi:hypothetical protein
MVFLYSAFALFLVLTPIRFVRGAPISRNKQTLPLNQKSSSSPGARKIRAVPKSLDVEITGA